MAEMPCRRLLIAATGSIHCTQLPQYILRLKSDFAGEVRVLMTPSAAQMCSPNVIDLVTDAPTLTDVWGDAATRAPHIRATRWADAFLVLPATANSLGKAANGIADDLVSTAVVAADGPVMFAPAMNPTMWQNAAVQRNVAMLRADGHYVVPPQRIVSVTTGRLDDGLGPDPDTLMTHLWHFHMRRLRDDYWETATADKPRTPSSQAPQRTLALATKRVQGASSAASTAPVGG